MIQTTDQIHKLTITTNAKERIKQLLSVDPANESLNLRIYINNVSCSGVEYFIAFDNLVEDDVIIEQDNIKVIVDPISFSYLKDATLDYMENIHESNFIIKNSASKSCCGCNENSCC